MISLAKVVLALLAGLLLFIVVTVVVIKIAMTVLVRKTKGGDTMNSEKAVKATRWFVEPRNSATNENAMMALVGLCNATEDKIYRGKVDNKGMMHDVVEVDHPFVALMERNIANPKHLFRVFTQTDGESAMKLWPFGTKKKLHRTKEVRRVAQVLARRPTRPKQ